MLRCLLGNHVYAIQVIYDAGHRNWHPPKFGPGPIEVAQRYVQATLYLPTYLADGQPLNSPSLAISRTYINVSSSAAIRQDPALGRAAGCILPYGLSTCFRT